ncbi:MAG: hypothetical protein AAGD10_13770 [Myxococcota bacterium]
MGRLGLTVVLLGLIGCNGEECRGAVISTCRVACPVECSDVPLCVGRTHGFDVPEGQRCCFCASSVNP